MPYTSSPYINCSTCDKLFAKKETKQLYCSPACKQKAYRLSHGQRSDSWNVLRERARKGAETKAGMSVLKVCECCGAEFYATGNNYGLVMYCSPACKQKAYRARKLASIPNPIDDYQESDNALF